MYVFVYEYLLDDWFVYAIAYKIIKINIWTLPLRPNSAFLKTVVKGVLVIKKKYHKHNVREDLKPDALCFNLLNDREPVIVLRTAAYIITVCIHNGS